MWYMGTHCQLLPSTMTLSNKNSILLEPQFEANVLLN